MATGGSYQFGPFRLDADSRLLTRSGAPVPLAPRTLDHLLVFDCRRTAQEGFYNPPDPLLHATGSDLLDRTCSR